MPCYTTGSALGDAQLDAEEGSRAATRATRAACDMMRQAKRLRVWEEFAAGLSRRTLNWIKEHETVDKERRTAEAQERKEERTRKAALKKLSKKERQVLGL